MSIPAILVLQKHLDDIKVLDESIVEIVKILLEKIETLEARVDALEGIA
tara:strand:- start:29 stop:175 length:147 start_codon:yes stop_codon:yes gene_type:complete